MKVTEKIQLIDRISSDLQQRYTFSDIKLFLDEFDVHDLENGYGGYNSKRIYAKDRLRRVSESVLSRMASELDIDAATVVAHPPKNWEDPLTAKVFITHLSTQKENAIKLRNALRPFNIEGFVAHEDIKPSREWEDEILKALNTMEFFISMHTKGMAKSIWCQQEIVFARARNVKIIPIRFEELPEGFIGRYQALARGTKKAETVAKDVLEILKTDKRTAELYSTKVKAFAEPDDDDIPF